MKVVAVGGQAQNGKDTVADHLMLRLSEMNQNWNRIAFAAKVKQIFCDTFGVDIDFIEKWKVVPEPPPGFIMSVRKGLQFIGDGFRTIQPEVWLNQPFRDRSNSLIISDVRYVNEFTRVYNEGGLNILIVKPDRLTFDSNGSEAQIRPYAEWFLFLVKNYFKDESRIVFDLRNLDWDLIRKQFNVIFPENIEYFHVFVHNNRSKQDLESAVDSDLLPIVLDFNFS